MLDSIEIQPVGPLRATVRPPGSKSITNRALVCAALAEGQSLLTGALESDDTRVMIESLGQLGIAVRHDRAARTIDVIGCGGRPPATSADMFVGNSGTTVRFLTAAGRAGPRRLSSGRRAKDAAAAHTGPAGCPAATRGRRRQRIGHRLPAGRGPRGRSFRAAGRKSPAISPASSSARCCWRPLVPKATSNWPSAAS